MLTEDVTAILPARLTSGVIHRKSGQPVCKPVLIGRRTITDAMYLALTACQH